jgi:hypothetical protein
VVRKTDDLGTMGELDFNTSWKIVSLFCFQPLRLWKLVVVVIRNLYNAEVFWAVGDKIICSLKSSVRSAPWLLSQLKRLSYIFKCPYDSEVRALADNYTINEQWHNNK